MRSVEILEIFTLELDVFQRSESGKLGETEEGDNRVHEGMRCGGGVRITMKVDGESMGQCRGQGAKEDRNRGRLSWHHDVRQVCKLPGKI